MGTRATREATEYKPSGLRCDLCGEAAEWLDVNYMKVYCFGIYCSTEDHVLSTALLAILKRRKMGTTATKYEPSGLRDDLCEEPTKYEPSGLRCDLCGEPAEWVDVKHMRVYCLGAQCSREEVIHSTREIRKTQRSMVCATHGEQRCHILGLNAVKVIFNAYAFDCLRIDDETLKELVIEINAKDNLYCCSAEQNVKDKAIEEAFLDCFLYKRLPYAFLQQEELVMYDAMKRIFAAVQEKMGDHPSAVINQILSDFETVAHNK